MEPIVLVAATRTAIGAFNGALSTIPAHDLGAYIIKSVIDKAGLIASNRPKRPSQRGVEQEIQAILGFSSD